MEAFTQRDAEIVADDRCPKCNDELDTGWECNQCGFDALPIIKLLQDPFATS